MLCFLRGMAFVPFLLVTWSSAAFIISYVVAVLSGHVNPFLPYISDTGTTPPESGIFGFMINFSAFLGISSACGPRWRCPSGFRLRCGIHAPAIDHLLQIMSPVEQPHHVPCQDGHLRRFLRSCRPQGLYVSCGERHL
ncbi:rCG48683, isoform CRA_a [Rattus norvegicus]|uniref:RCG48683, isoform CRA_a n=1 Tax=Rattus norvegicus TaxID=10116 RepID=A6IFN9_RAT|nr:rCG48683, isoform CRA_a [Rattus norvegicus]